MIIQGSPDILSTEFGLNNQSALGFVVTVDTSQTELEQYLAQRALQYQRADIEANLYDLSEAIGQAKTLAQQQAAQAAYETAELAAQQATQSVAAFQQAAAQATAQITAREQAQFAENRANAQAVAVEQAAYVATIPVTVNTTQYEIDQIIAARKLLEQNANIEANLYDLNEAVAQAETFAQRQAAQTAYAAAEQAAQLATRSAAAFQQAAAQATAQIAAREQAQFDENIANVRAFGYPGLDFIDFIDFPSERVSIPEDKRVSIPEDKRVSIPEDEDFKKRFNRTVTSGINPALALAAVAAYFIVG